MFRSTKRTVLSVLLAMALLCGGMLITAPSASAAGGCGAGYKLVDSKTDREYGSVKISLYANPSKAKVWCAVTTHAKRYTQLVTDICDITDPTTPGKGCDSSEWVKSSGSVKI